MQKKQVSLLMSIAKNFKNSSPIIHPVHVRNCFIKKNIVNPKNLETTCVYVASGPDISSPLLSTNATTYYFFDDFHYSKEKWEMRVPYLATLNKYREEIAHCYVLDKFYNNYIDDGFINTKKRFLGALYYELSTLNIRNLIPFFRHDSAGISFHWKHPLAKEEKKYSILFIKADLEKGLSQLPPGVSSFFKEPYDFYFQKAGMMIYQGFPRLLHFFYAKLKSNGYFLIDDLYEKKSEIFFNILQENINVSEVVYDPQKIFYKETAEISKKTNPLYGAWQSIYKKI